MEALKIFICVCGLLWGAAGAHAGSDLPAEANTSPSGGGVVRTETRDMTFVYAARNGACEVIWTVRVPRDDSPDGLSLWPKFSTGESCLLPFTDQLPLHRRVLGRIFKEWHPEKFRMLTLGALARFDPSHAWNIRIARAAAASPEWNDYCRNYPDHAGGRSSNQIYVDLVNHANACRELAGLFGEFGLNIRLNAVEKVFALPADQLDFYPELREKGLEDTPRHSESRPGSREKGLEGAPRLMYDAGINYFIFSVTDSE